MQYKTRRFNENLESEKQTGLVYVKHMEQDKQEVTENDATTRLALKNTMIDQYLSSKDFRKQKVVEQKELDKQYMERKITEAHEFQQRENFQKNESANTLSKALDQMRAKEQIKRKDTSDRYIGRPNSARQIIKDMNVSSRTDGQCTYKTNQSNGEAWNQFSSRREKIDFDHMFRQNLRPNLYCRKNI